MNWVVSHWSANAVVFAACAVVVAAHLLGMRAIAGDAGQAGAGKARAARLREAQAFYLGLLTVVVAVASPLGYWAQRYLWVRSLQDLLLAEAAPALIVLGAPWPALARVLRRRRGRAGEAAPRARGERPAPGAGLSPPAAKALEARASWPGVRRQTWLGWPLAAAVAYNAGLWVLHLPALYDGALASPWLYGAQDAAYLALGAALWLQLIGSAQFTPQLPPLRRVILVAGTVVSTTVLGMALAFSRGLIYPAYQGPDGGLARAVTDQQLAGAVFWVLSLPPLVIVGVAILSRWLKNEESEALAADLDRLLKRPTSAWPSRPGL